MKSRSGPALAWTFFILLLCSIPGRDLPGAPISGFDKIVHLGMFLVLGVLWLRWMPHRTGAILAAGFAYAVFTELYQGWLPFGRTPDPYDALADALGMLVALAVHRQREPGRAGARGRR